MDDRVIGLEINLDCRRPKVVIVCLGYFFLVHYSAFVNLLRK